jgi:ubiquinone biosynthesis protein
MEYIEGFGINDHEALKKAGIDMEKTAEKLAESICNQILRDGFFHADPHPGNIKVLPDGTIVFLDLGMVGHISEMRKKTISRLFVAISNKDSKMVVRSILDLDAMPERKNIKRFEQDVDMMIEKYLTLPWSKIKIGELFYEIFKIASINGIKIPREFAMLAKSLATLQSILEKLAPELNTLVIAKPIAKKLVYQSYSIKNISNVLTKNIVVYKDLLSKLPFYIQNLLEKAEDGDLTVRLGIKDMDKIQKQINRALNRISFSVILLAVSIIITGIIIGSSQNANAGSEMYFLNITALKAGFAVVVIIILGLIISILRSGNLK